PGPRFVGVRSRRADPFHSPRQADRESVRRELQRPDAGRVSERELVRRSGRRAHQDRLLAHRLQRGSAPQRAGQPNSNGVRAGWRSASIGGRTRGSGHTHPRHDAQRRAAEQADAYITARSGSPTVMPLHKGELTPMRRLNAGTQAHLALLSVLRYRNTYALVAQVDRAQDSSSLSACHRLDSCTRQVPETSKYSLWHLPAGGGQKRGRRGDENSDWV